MAELGKYAVTVLSAYAATIALMAVLVALTLARGARVRRMLAAQEARMGEDGR